MRINCTSCGYEINLDHEIFFDYAGPVKCFCCGSMMEVKTADGFAYSVNPMGIIKHESNHRTVENPGLRG